MNKIVFMLYHGSPSSSQHEGSKIIFFHTDVNKAERIEIETEENLMEGDRVSYQGRTTQVIHRLYLTETQNFSFLCNSVYTYKRAE